MEGLRLSVVAVAAAVALAGCGGGTDEPTYSRAEVEKAFADHGLALREAPALQEAGENDTILVPRKPSPLVVIVGKTDEEAEEGFEALVSQQTADTYDARRANVVAFSDDRVSAAVRTRIRAALDALPDRGAAVTVAG